MLNGEAANLARSYGLPARLHNGRVISKYLLDGDRVETGVRPEFRELIGVLEQRINTIADQIGRCNITGGERSAAMIC